MKHTLNELERHFNPDTMVLNFAEHTVEIDTYKQGSNALIRAFENFKFSTYMFVEETKTLIATY